MKRSIKQVSPNRIIGSIFIKEDGTKETIKYENPIPFPSADTEEFRKEQDSDKIYVNTPKGKLHFSKKEVQDERNFLNGKK